MSYKFQQEEQVSVAIKRIAIEQIDKGIASLSEPIEDRDSAIHAARLSLKKLRGVIRLVRDEIGQESYTLENRSCRNAGRLLSSARDATVALETFEKLRELAGGKLKADEVADLRGVLIGRLRQDQEERRPDAELFASVIGLLGEAKDRVPAWSIEREDFRALQGGLISVYRRARRGYTMALADPTLENLHEWRKEVKYLWYHLRMLRPVWPVVLGAVAGELHILSIILGEDHDLGMFHLVMNELPEPSGLLLQRIQRRRCQLQQDATSRGARLFREPPRSFVGRIHGYWERWQEENWDKNIL